MKNDCIKVELRSNPWLYYLTFLGYFQREEATPEESYRRMIEDFIVSLEVAG